MEEPRIAVPSSPPALWPGDVHWRPVSPRLIVLRRVTLVIPLLSALAVAVAVYLISGSAAGAAVFLAGALLLLTWWWLIIGRAVRSWGYAERDDDLLIRHGVLVQRLTIVPYGRMQYVDVSVGPLERLVGLASVRLHTAAEATNAHIPGLPSVEAARLREKLAALGEARAAGL